jgi:uncharacterized membrane protein
VIEDLQEEELTESPPLNRMAIATLALIGVLMSVYLTLHKYGFIGTLACGTGSCDTVQTSPWAVFLGILPVPLMGVFGYLVLMVIAIAGIQPGQTNNKKIGILLFILADIALLFTIYLTYLEAFVIHAWCRWCLGSAALVLLIWICSVPELLKLRRVS